MQKTIVVIAALVVPPLWGYAVYWIMKRLWPRPEDGAAAGKRGDDSQWDDRTAPLDYQI